MPLPGATSAARRRPVRARRSASVFRCCSDWPLERRSASPTQRPARPRGLVLLPTRELAVQVYEVLAPLGAAMGLNVAAVYGGADIERQIKALRKGCDVIIATPGRLIDLGDRGEVNVENLDVLGARRGRPHGRHGLHAPGRVGAASHRRSPHQTLLFSATLDGAIDRLVKRYLTDPGLSRSRERHPDRLAHGAPFLAGPPDGPRQGRGDDLSLLRQDDHLLSHQARRRSSRRATAKRGRARGRDPR